MRPNLSLFLRRKFCSILRLFSWLIFWVKMLLKNKKANVPSTNCAVAPDASDSSIPAELRNPKHQA